MVRHAFVRDEPLVQRDRVAAGAEPTRGTGPDKLVRRRLLFVGACVAAFLLGFVGVAALMWDTGSASSARPKAIPTSTVPAPAGAPAPPTSARRSTAPPPSALVAAPAGGGFPTTSPSTPAPTPHPDNAGAPAPSTSSPSATTTPPTTTPTTTAP